MLCGTHEYAKEAVLARGSNREVKTCTHAASTPALLDVDHAIGRLDRIDHSAEGYRLLSAPVEGLGKERGSSAQSMRDILATHRPWRLREAATAGVPLVRSDRERTIERICQSALERPRGELLASRLVARWTIRPCSSRLS